MSGLTENRGAGRGLNWLAGRSSRREYWTCVGSIVAVGVAMNYLLPSGETGLSGAIFVFQIRRLHDLGRTGWWALGANLLTLAGFALMPFLSLNAAVGAGTLIGLGILVVIGALPGQQEENRFGPPPERKSATAEVFD